jgi:hypothetical protein
MIVPALSNVSLPAWGLAGIVIAGDEALGVRKLACAFSAQSRSREA